MKKRSLKLTGFLAILGVAILIGWLAFTLGTSHMQQANAEEPNTSSLLQLTDDDAVLGNAGAPVTIIEYSSMSCPHCAMFHNKILPELQTKYIDKGIVKITNRHFPLNEPALRAAMLTKCVGKEREITFTKVLFELQNKWAFGKDFQDQLQKLAAVGGFGPEEFDACMANQELETQMLESRQKADEQLKISATPTFFINGVVMQGDVTLENFEKAIEKAQSAE